jgi:histidine ammonia-lyase
VERVIAIEAICAAQALDLRIEGHPDLAPGVGVRAAHAMVRDAVPHLDADREPGPDLEAATALVRSGRLADLARQPGAGTAPAA